MDFKSRDITKDRGTFHNDESIYHENKPVLIYTYWTKDRQLNNYNAPLSILDRTTRHKIKMDIDKLNTIHLI